MGLRFSIFLVLCIALFGAILAGYWDMMSSERNKKGEERLAGSASVPAAPVPGTTEAPSSAAPAAPGAKEASPTNSRTPAPETFAQGAVPAAPPSASSSTETAETQATSATPSQARPETPRFDLLRVEPDGSAVIAGQAPADSEVRILSGDRQVGSAKASRAGDFALVLDERLTVGSHQIRIEARRPDGRTDASAEVAVVSVPQPGRPGELLAMIEQPGQPSRLISVPRIETPSAPTEAGAVPTDEPVAASPSSEADKQASVDPGAPPTAASPVDPQAPPQSFAVEAVEIENGTIYVAGRAAGKEPVRVYVDDKLVGEDRIRANGRFLVTAQVPLTTGEHRIRADIVGADGKVASRVEVPFTKPEGETMSALASSEPAAASPPAPAPVAGDVAKDETVAATAPSRTPDAATAPRTPGGPDAGEVGTVVQPALERVDTRVLIRRGDTLWRISRDTYGFGRRYTVIYLANGDQIRNPNRIYPGQLLRLPKHDGAETQTR